MLTGSNFGPRSGQSQRTQSSIRNQTDADIALWHFTQSRDRAIESSLVRYYSGFAYSIAHRMSVSRSDREDVEQVALVALLEAIRRYDPDHGVKLTTFAYKTIEGAIKRYFRDHGSMLRAPRSTQDRVINVTRTTERLTHEFDRSPTVKEIAGACTLTPDEVIEALEASRKTTPVSLDGGGIDNGPLDVGTMDAGLESSDLMLQASKELNRLSVRDRHIFDLRFFRDLSQTEIAKEVGVSQMQVSRVLAQICARLRDQLDDVRTSSDSNRVLVADTGRA